MESGIIRERRRRGIGGVRVRTGEEVEKIGVCEKRKVGGGGAWGWDEDEVVDGLKVSDAPLPSLDLLVIFFTIMIIIIIIIVQALTCQ